MEKNKILITLTLFFTFCITTNAQKRIPLPECKFRVMTLKAYFYTLENSGETEKYLKRKAYLTKNDIISTICKYSFYDYVYVEYKNKKGQITKGYIKNSDLEVVDP